MDKFASMDGRKRSNAGRKETSRNKKKTNNRAESVGTIMRNGAAGKKSTDARD